MLSPSCSLLHPQCHSGEIDMDAKTTQSRQAHSTQNTKAGKAGCGDVSGSMERMWRWWMDGSCVVIEGRVGGVSHGQEGVVGIMQ